MRINHNITALNNHRNMSLNNTALAKNMEKLSSGLRINRAADDAAGLAVSEKMRGQIRGLEQAQRNVQDGISFVQTAEGAMNEISAMLVRMKELKVQSLNGTYQPSDISNINQELNALGSQIKLILSNTKFNGIGIKTGAKIASDDRATTITINGIAVTVNTALSLGGLSKDTNLSQIEAAIEHVAKERAKLGALQNRLEYTSNNLGTTIENLTASESRIRDTDMAKEMVELAKNQILLQSSQAMLAQANAAPQGVLTLLR
ncbi:flagellin/flagellar hook associated protein [Thermobacillus composti KWC4]|uniref:Flagellin n=1 Tax=Thermobacillus composti (strain DSM 18247 / JCM 13945 / KWC4) TaxID=717605 RepID=L0E9P5_THECK|nr:flagellin [Thermobacillus composti]AGA56406.1 flagellin/flagellar hook associated protein [Thermobacillus composti KWC4]